MEHHKGTQIPKQSRHATAARSATAAPPSRLGGPPYQVAPPPPPSGVNCGAWMQWMLDQRSMEPECCSTPTFQYYIWDLGRRQPPQRIDELFYGRLRAVYWLLFHFRDLQRCPFYVVHPAWGIRLGDVCLCPPVNALHLSNVFPH